MSNDNKEPIDSSANLNTEIINTSGLPPYNGIQTEAAPPPYPGVNMIGANMQPLTFEQMMIHRQQLMQQQREYIRKRLVEHYPAKYAIVHSILLIILSVLIFILQIVMITKRVPNYFIGSGIWVGAYFFVAAGLALGLITNRSYRFYLATSIIHFFGFIVSIAGLVIVNIIGYTTASFNCNSYFTYSCTQPSPYNIVFIVFGIFFSILSLSFAIKLQSIVGGYIGHRYGYGHVYYNTSMGLPQNYY